MFARQIKGNDEFYYLETDQALFGYGSGDGDNGSSTSKQGKVRAETLDSGTAIACVPVLNQNDIRGKLINSKERAMFYWWTVIQNYMDEDASNNLYDTSTHLSITVVRSLLMP